MAMLMYVTMAMPVAVTDGLGHLGVTTFAVLAGGILTTSPTNPPPTNYTEPSVCPRIANPHATYDYSEFPGVATNGQPAFYIGPNVQQANQAMGGIINTGPLKGIYFGPGGVPAMMNYGTGTNGTYMIGGPKFQQFQGDNNLDQINHRQSAYLRLSYDVTDDINVFFEANYSRSAVIFQGSGKWIRANRLIDEDATQIDQILGGQPPSGVQVPFSGPNRALLPPGCRARPRRTACAHLSQANGPGPS